MTTNQTRREHRTMCPMNCHPTYCGMIVEIEDGHVTAIRGDDENPDSRGFLCIRGRSAGEILDNPRRLLYPRLRNRRDPSAWRDSGWDEALDRIAGAIRAAGPEATAVWPGHGVFLNGLGGQFAARFAHMAGVQTWNPSMVCWGLGGLGFWLTGVSEVNTMDDMAAHADLIVLWGANLVSQPNTAPRLVAARKRGARVIAIDVRRTEAFAQADETILVRPGTDAALALALMHVILAEGLEDPAFIEAHTVGADDLRAHVRPYTPEWAEGETGVPAERIRALARSYAGTKRSMILAGGSSMHKSGNGWRAARAIACLPALTGALGVEGAGMGPRHAAQSHGMGMNRIVPADVKPAGTAMLNEMSTILDEIEGGRIKVLVMLGTNMLSSFADSGRIARAMERMDLVACLDLFPNEMTDEHVDVLLPGTAWLEETGFKATNTHLYLMDQALAPAGEARPAWWVLNELARRLGVEGFFPWDSIDGALDAIFDHEAMRHTTTASLRAAGGLIPLAVSPVAHPDLRFPTPSGKVEFVSEKAVALGLPALPDYAPAIETHRAAPGSDRYPLVFVQGRTINHFHGFYDHGRALPTLAKREPGPVLWINPADAAARTIADGGAVRIANERGEMTAAARVTDDVPAGRVWMRDGWPGINTLTSGARSVPDAVAAAMPFAGSAAYEARVEVIPVAVPAGAGRG
jgi:anaerobic selenocysteine-containing dehydrogenase